MKRFIRALAGAALVVGGSTVFAQDHDAHHTKPLTAVMQELGEKMNALNDAIFKDDWVGMSTASGVIAEHPHVAPNELAAISKALGKEMQQFKEWDHLVHKNALSLRKAAADKDMKQVLSSHRTIMSGCVSCHIQFRAKVQKALNRG